MIIIALIILLLLVLGPALRPHYISGGRLLSADSRPSANKNIWAALINLQEIRKKYNTSPIQLSGQGNDNPIEALPLEDIITSDWSQLIIYRAPEQYVGNHYDSVSITFGGQSIIFERELKTHNLSVIAFEHSLFNNGSTTIIRDIIVAAAEDPLSIFVASARPGIAHLAAAFGPAGHASITAKIVFESICAADQALSVSTVQRDMLDIFATLAPNITVQGPSAKNRQVVYKLLYAYTTNVSDIEIIKDHLINLVAEGGSLIIICDIDQCVSKHNGMMTMYDIGRKFLSAQVIFGELGAMTAALVYQSRTVEESTTSKQLSYTLPVINYIKEYRKACPSSLSFDDAAICYAYNNQQAMKWCIENTGKLRAPIQQKEINFIISDHYVYISKDFLIAKAAALHEGRAIDDHYTALVAPGLRKLQVFPSLPGVDKEQLQFTKDSLFSATPWPDTIVVNNHIKKYLGDLSALSVLDGTSNIGGNALGFARAFGSMTAVEIMPRTYEALLNNLKTVYKDYITPKTTVVRGNTVEFLKTVAPGQFDVFFLDPPWGGIPYKFYKRVRLFLSDIDIGVLLSQHWNKFRLFVMKVPPNYDVEGLISTFKLHRLKANIELKNVEKYLCIFIELTAI
jgi:16S rRNA G966 N2-methylase RsmD